MIFFCRVSELPLAVSSLILFLPITFLDLGLLRHHVRLGSKKGFAYILDFSQKHHQ